MKSPRSVDVVAGHSPATFSLTRAGLTRNFSAQAEDGTIHVSVDNAETGSKETVVVDGLLVATGRRPNVTGLGLEQAGVEYDKCACSLIYPHVLLEL